MEEWKKVEGYDEYEVSSFGHLRKNGVLLSTVRNIHPITGYVCLRKALYKDGNQKQFTIARLIGNAFIPNPDSLPTIDHIDGNSENNRVDNLRWASHQTQNLNKRYPMPISGHKYIHAHFNQWWVHIRRNKVSIFRQQFPTLEEAIVARDGFLTSLA